VKEPKALIADFIETLQGHYKALDEKAKASQQSIDVDNIKAMKELWD